MWGIFAHHVEAVQPEQSTAWKVSLLLDVFGPWSQALQLLRLSRLRLLQVVPYPSKMRKENWTQCGFLILVGGLEHVLFSIAHMGYHPSHWRTPWFFKMVKTTNQDPYEFWVAQISSNTGTVHNGSPHLGLFFLRWTLASDNNMSSGSIFGSWAAEHPFPERWRI